MRRFVIITIGKTHSGKTTFAKALEQQLNNSIVIDQDNHAEFINNYYRNLVPQRGPNSIKYAITQTIVDYAVQQTDLHLILCNSNRARKGRIELLEHFRQKGFTTILANFEIPDHILQERVSSSERSTSIFRSAASFEEVLKRQQAETYQNGVSPPTEDEADFLFVIRDAGEVLTVIQSIVDIANTV